MSSLLCDVSCFVCSAHGSSAAHTHFFSFFLFQILLTEYKPTGELYTPAAARSNMAKSNDLKIFLESSLNEIFKATVSDILDSVDRTLSEYQGTIQRIESENEGLKRLLFAQKSSESAARGTVVSARCIMEGISVFVTTVGSVASCRH